MNPREYTARSGRGARLRALGCVSVFLACAAAASLAGCAGSRHVLTDEQLQARSAADKADMVRTFDDSVDTLLRRMERRTAESPGDTTLNILAMSGGGDYGAFGAGVLVGWGKIADPEWRRPDFDAVTGVSTGALLAPFAYVGTDESCREVEDFYRNPKPDWLHDRGLLFFLPSNPSFMELPGLDRDVRSAIDAEFVGMMAEQSRAGKIIIVSATDLDLGRQRFWELGSEARHATKSGDIERVQNILLSSAAIPAVFPPVEIGPSAYGDGGVTANVFLRLEHRNPRSFLQRWLAERPGKPFPKVRYWIIINNQLAHIPKTVQPKWPEVLGPALETAIRSATLAEVRWLSAEVDFVNALYHTDVEVRVIGIPDDWRPPVKGDFKKETMNSLADLGEKLGADPNSWQVWATPKTAIDTVGFSQPD